MIKNIKIQGFQSHKDTFLELNPNVNILLGASDSGKSAILRALLWLVQNKPGGFSFCSNWGDTTSVQIEVDNHTITRFRNKNTNKYVLDNLEFNAIGTDVPKEILDVLNINDVNINRQLDQPYLLSKSSGEVASHFNSIAGLEVIDRATSNINSAIRELTSDIKYSEGQEKTLQEGLEKYAYLGTFESEVTALEELDKQLVKTSANADKLGKLLETYQKNTDTVLQYKELLELEKPVDEILELIELRAEKDIAVVKLDRLIVQIKEVQSLLINQNAVLLIEKPVNDLLKLYKEKETFVEQHKKLRKAILSLDGVKIQLDQAKAEYTRLHTQFEKNMPDVCFFCGQTIKKSK